MDHPLVRRLLSIDSGPKLEDSSKATEDPRLWLSKGPFLSVLQKGHQVYYVPFIFYLDYYMKRMDFRLMNEHFAPSYQMCNPCALGFDSYINFDLIEPGILEVLDQVGAPHWYYQTGKEHSKVSMLDLADLFFANLPKEELTSMRQSLEERTGYSFEGAPEESISRDLLKEVFEHLSIELDLYYSLFPEAPRLDKKYLQ
jgi:hypothetical protein